MGVDPCRQPPAPGADGEPAHLPCSRKRVQLLSEDVDDGLAPYINEERIHFRFAAVQCAPFLVTR